MTERQVETEITFAHPFLLDALVTALDAGTYRLTVDEEEIPGLSFVAYRTVAAHLEIPSIDRQGVQRQYLQVSTGEIEAVLLKDKQT